MTNDIHRKQRTLILLVVVAIFVVGCGQYASRGAVRGAAGGAAAGALGALVVGLVFNDRNLTERVGRAAVYGATVGAVAGGVSGAQRDKAEERAAAQRQAAQSAQPPEMTEAEIIAAIGRGNFDALVALSACRHVEAVELSKAGLASTDRDHQEASLWIQAITAYELGDEAVLDRLYAELLKYDPELGQPARAQAALNDGVRLLQQDRLDQGRSAVCS